MNGDVSFSLAWWNKKINRLPFGKDLAEPLQYLAGLDLTSEVKMNLGAFGPRYNTPKSGRAWVFELTVSTLAQEKFRIALFTIMSFLQERKSELLKIENMRKGPQGLRQALWDDLKKLQPVASASK